MLFAKRVALLSLPELLVLLGDGAELHCALLGIKVSQWRLPNMDRWLSVDASAAAHETWPDSCARPYLVRCYLTNMMLALIGQEELSQIVIELVRLNCPVALSSPEYPATGEVTAASLFAGEIIRATARILSRAPNQFHADLYPTPEPALSRKFSPRFLVAWQRIHCILAHKDRADPYAARADK